MRQSEIEKKILEFWKQDNTFQKSVEKKAPRGDFVFYDGPPFATGTPHYGHIVASLMKDMVPRYWTMLGFRVERRWGWDCHGLPIENIVEKEHGFKHKKDILAYGVDKFNEDSRGKVLMYAKEWREVIDRLGRWVDMDNDYKTMDTSFMESIWWAFKQLYDKGLLYEAYRSMHICPRCETTLAQSEVAQGYKEVTDLSVIVKFKVILERSPKGGAIGSILDSIGRPAASLQNDNIYLLAWTTTPWTLPGNVVLAVGENVKYVFVESGGEHYILAKERVEMIFKDKENKIISEVKTKDLIGLEYEPLFPYYDNNDVENRANGFKVYAADFVNTEEGTGIVHIAPAFGEDDMNLGREKNLPFVQHVNMDGTFNFPRHSERSEAESRNPLNGASGNDKGSLHSSRFAGLGRDDGFLESLHGLPVKHQDEPDTEDHPETKVESADVKIIKYLAAKNLLFSKEKYTHSYPHCWRCDSPLLNYAASSWFVDVTKLKQKLLKEARDIYWMPEHIKEGRFGNWLTGARDWSVSRQRFWGSVLPIWKSENGKEVKVIGSIDELRAQANIKITKIIFTRHAESEKNVSHTHSSALDKHPLTKRGERQAKELAKMLSGEKVDAIISSPILRARQTAEAVAKKLGIKIKFDDRLLEDNNGVWEEKHQEELEQDPDYQKFASLPLEKKFEYRLGGAESAKEVCKRVQGFIKSLAKDFAGQTVVVVGHGMVGAAFGRLLTQAGLEKFYYLCDYFPLAEPRFYYLNEDGSGFDLHKHHIDKITLKGKAGRELRRIPDVLDCWFESGSMPFAQLHYPFENKERFEKNFPAQFIAEGVDQTRAWFYYLHVLSVALAGGESFKNVVVNGIVLAENGQKMSKRLKNYPDPMEMFEKYGADAVRYYLATSPVLRAEDLNFSEKGVEEVVKKVLLILYNVLSFYKLYESLGQEDGKWKMENGKENPSSIFHSPSSHVLDRWIVTKTNQLVNDVTDAYNHYDLNKATRPLAEFVNELSTWYLRRSRERIKDGDRQALETLKWSLEQLALVMAPVMPFAAEYVWQELKNPLLSEEGVGGGARQSVHLQEWPKAGKVNEEILKEMETVRKVVEVGLSLRAEVQIKVRQPLKSAKIRSKLNKDGIELVKEELNVKDLNIEVSDSVSVSDKPLVELDTTMSNDLRLEGHLRELVRTINGMRKDAGLTPGDVITLTYHTESEELRKVFGQFTKELAKAVIASEIKEGENKGEEVEVNGEKIRIEISC